MSELDSDSLSETHWHALSADDALLKLSSQDSGLSDSEARERHQRLGSNSLPEDKPAGLLQILARQFRDPLIYVLLIAAGVSLVLGNFANAIFITAVLLINAGVGALQEGRAEASASSLRDMVRIKSRVRRDNRESRIDATTLVPGDVVVLQAGDAVPADLRLLESDGLEVDEATLTGESTPVGKNPDTAVDEGAVVSDRINMVFAASTVMDGTATGVVCRIGEGTQVGQIAESLAEGQSQAPPLVIKMRRLTRQIAVFVLVAVVLLSVSQLLRGVEIERLFFLGVALAVSAIPAGLPIAITVAMALATRRMAEQNVIVRQLPAVEGLGSCTLIASDKTGTLTENILTIRRLQLADEEEWRVSGEGYAPDGEIQGADDESPGDASCKAIGRIVRAGALCNEARVRFGSDGSEAETEGDSVDLSFLVLAAKLDQDRDALREQYPEKGAIPFSAKRRYAASFNEVEGSVEAHVKGAAEAVIPMCANVDADTLRERESNLANQGFRVLALAAGPVDSADDFEEQDLQELDFLGFAALIDPIRSEVPDAIQRCKRAGVQVRMITGDHPSTGLAIARELDIAGDADEALTGAEMRELDDDEELAERIRNAPVFARVEPQQKTRIVETLQRSGELVAVTGDGVNDAPALKTAHIGVAMGREGTDVARSAASLILTDDNFASLVDGIEQGRGAYDNVRKVTWLLLATGVAEVLLFFLALFTGLPIPLTAVQLLWLNLVTNGIQDVALASERVEPDVLNRKPRSPGEPILDRRMIQETLTSGLYMGSVAFVLFYCMMEWFGLDEFAARNLVLLQMVLFENVHALSCRSESRSVLRIPLNANRMLFVAVAAAQGIHIAAMYTPGISEVLALQPVPLKTWAMMLCAAISLLVLDEIAKWMHRRRHAIEAGK